MTIFSQTHCPGCREKLVYVGDEQLPDDIIEEHTAVACLNPDPVVLERVKAQWGDDVGDEPPKPKRNERSKQDAR